jgi:D-sedoheptulose 7-phosphate isomerase
MTYSANLEDSTERFKQYFEESLNSIQSLITDENIKNFNILVQTICKTIDEGKIIAVAGNGGSHADATHIAAELVNQFTYEHHAFPVLALGTNSAILTSWANDKDFNSQLSRELSAFKQQIGLLICLTTSGKSENVNQAISIAKQNNIKTCVLAANKAKEFIPEVDILIYSRSSITSNIQDSHVVLYHALCREVEYRLSNKTKIDAKNICETHN